jgi:chromosome segregation ATPase
LDGDSPVSQKLLLEVQQLRLAIERFTLWTARTQLAVTRLQIEGAAATRMSQQLNDLRQQGIDLSHRRDQDAARLKEWEGRASSMATPDQRREIESLTKTVELELEELTAREQDRSARKSELASQFQAAQKQLAESSGAGGRHGAIARCGTPAVDQSAVSADKLLK